MGQNAPLSWKRSDFLDGLARALNVECPLIRRLEEHIVSVLNVQDETVVRRYLLLYTIPVLEICGFTKAGDWNSLCFWGVLQTRLGVHLRYLDNIVDGDQSIPNTAAALLTSHYLLADVKRELAAKHMPWCSQQDDIYGQFFSFESENRSGFNHSFDSPMATSITIVRGNRNLSVGVNPSPSCHSLQRVFSVGATPSGLR